MRKILPVLIVASLFGASQLVNARGGGNGGGGGPAAAAPHSSGPSPRSQAAENSNGRFATGRETGLDRAQERMSEQGKAHEKATTNTKKRPDDRRDADAIRARSDRR